MLAAGFDPAGRGDAMLEARVDGDVRPGRAALGRPPTPAAVLVPLVERPEGLTVLLTQRTDHLAHHPGQISFPGGRLEESDGGDPLVAALRETEEEIGLGRERVTILGRLDLYVTGTGFGVTPVVGVVTPPFELSPDPFEVAEVFEVPLHFLLDPENHKLNRVVVEGRHRPFWSMTWEERVIWGATAGILVNLSEVLLPQAGRP
ncbi:MAG: CoA pyrophosphatase [Magnetospirillum sp.]|nr:CoA pyrophosphatase [Magnetospirillum sp.]